MIKNITIGQYIPGDTVIHRLDPRGKIIAMFLYMISLFVVDSLYQYIPAAILLFFIIILSKIKVKYIIKGLKPIFAFVILTFIINIFTIKGEVLFKFSIFTISKEGLFRGTTMAIRLILLVTGTNLLTLTTSPIDLTDGIEKLLKPFEKIKLPAHEIAMMITIALRFIPILLEETDKIIKAQKSRGADFESGNIIKRVKSFIPVLIPLFISAFRRADDLAVAMESRCYRGSEGRTKMKVLTIKKEDILAIGVMTTLLIYTILIRVLI